MSLQELSKQELKEKFDIFIFNIDDYLEELIKKFNKKGYILDYTLDSLDTLEKYILKEKIVIDSDDVNDAGCYFGEVIRKNYGGNWICSLDNKNSMYYGKPVITGHTEPEDLELSPIDDVQTLIIRPRKNHFKTIIQGHINPEEIDWTGFPDED